MTQKQIPISLKCKECGNEEVALKFKYIFSSVDFRSKIKIGELDKKYLMKQPELLLKDTGCIDLYCLYCKKQVFKIVVDGEEVEQSDLIVKFPTSRVVLPNIEIQLAIEMSKEKIERMKFEEIAKSKEGRNWVYKASEIAEKEGLKHEIEDYSYGSIIRFASPNDPNEEAFISYKKVEWLTEFVGYEVRCVTRDKLQEKVREVIIEILKEGKIVPGYRLEDKYDGLVKTVETPEDAIAEVKSIISRVKEVKEQLKNIFDPLKDIFNQ